MAINVNDRVRESTSTTGTGSVTLSGAPAGFQTFDAGIGVGNQTYYTIADPATGAWEVGIGTLSGSTTLARTQVLRSSNANALVNFGSGSKDVFVSYPADMSVSQADVGTAPNQIPLNQYLGNLAYEDADNIAGNVGIGGNLTVVGGVTSSNPSVISVNSASTALRITQVGAGNALVVEDSANPDSTATVIDANGRLIVGGTVVGVPVAGIASGVSVNSDATIGNALSVFQWSASAVQPFITMTKSRGATAGTQSIVSSGDGVGTILWSASDGANFVQAARIEAFVDGTPATNAMPGRLVFSTTAAGSAIPTERMRIDSAGNTTFGSAGTVAGQTVRISKNVTGATASYGLMNRGIVQSDVTDSYRAYHTILETAASAFTLPSASQYAATQGTIGATSAVTNQYGFIAESSLIGATNNYGFYSNIATGTGRWNFYANGNANNYFGGNVGIGGAPSELLDVYSNGRAFMQITRASANSIQPAFAFRKARGTTSAYTAVVADDWVGDIQFYGHDGTGFIQAAYIGVFVDGTPGTNNMPGRLSFATTLDGSSVPTERLRISAAGTVSLQNSAGLSISRTAVTAPAATDGNVFSGTYTPTLTNTTNVASSTAYQCQYMRVGNTVTIGGVFDLTPTAASTDTVLRISLPIASNFTSFSQLNGVASCASVGEYGEGGSIVGEATLDVAEVRLRSSVTTPQLYSFSITYRII